MRRSVDPADKYLAFHNALWRTIGSQADISGHHVIRQPAFVPVKGGYSDSTPGEGFPVLKHLGEALEIARAHGFREAADAFEEIASDLPWSQNPRYVAEGVRHLLDGYAYASLSGPEGPIKCMAPRGGFYLMGPDVTYPNHNHAPREVYFIMTPGIEWCLDNGDWFTVQPGDLIYHTPWQMHAMRTGASPGLAYVAWLEPGNRLGVSWGQKHEQA